MVGNAHHAFPSHTSSFLGALVLARVAYVALMVSHAYFLHRFRIHLLRSAIAELPALTLVSEY
jgi:hypothetical protein